MMITKRALSPPILVEHAQRPVGVEDVTSG